MAAPPAPEIRVADDSAPYARRVAARLRASAADAELRPLLAQLRAPVLLRSGTGAEQAVIRPGDHGLAVEDGYGATDAEAAAGDLAATLERLLDGPPRTWQELAHAFWAATSQRPGTPARVRFVCTDDGAELTVGTPGAEPSFQLHGTAADLSAYLRGDVALAPAVLSGESLGAHGSIALLSVMQGNGLAMVLAPDV